MTLKQHVDNNLSVNYSCPICTFVVWQAVECNKCKCLYCEKCIDSWLISGPNCPACRKVFVRSIVNKFSGRLNEAKFKCRIENCKEVFEY